MTERRTWSQSDSMIPSHFIRPAHRFMELEAASGLVLIGATAIALLWANLPFGESYEEFWETRLLLQLGPIDINESPRHVVNRRASVRWGFMETGDGTDDPIAVRGQTQLPLGYCGTWPGCRTHNRDVQSSRHGFDFLRRY